MMDESWKMMAQSQEDNISGPLLKASYENSQKGKPFHTSLALKLFTVDPDKLFSSKSLPVVLLLVLSQMLLAKLYLWAFSFPWLNVNNLRHIFELSQLLNMLIASKWVLGTPKLLNLKCEHGQLVSL